ncbi:hypothetical protein ACH4NF_18145, partial [Streptomyces sp. NPDC017248]
MEGNAGDEEEAVEERDGYDGELDDSEADAGETDEYTEADTDIDEYTEPEPYDVEPEPYGRAAPARETAVGPAGETAGVRLPAGVDPDVFLDVPVLKVDEIELDVEDLRAHVSLQAEVLDLVRLNVGADVSLGRVHLGISGVDAQAQLRVRLDNVAAIINRVLTTLDRNPEILHELARGVGSAVQDVGGGARRAIGELGTGAGSAVQDVGLGARAAVRDVGRGVGSAARDVGRGAGAAVQDVGGGVGSAARDVGQGAGSAVGDVGTGAGRVVEDVGGEAGRTVGATGAVAGGTGARAAEEAAGVTEVANEAGRTVRT